MSKQNSLKRTLKSRHMSMIAIGGTVGAGLFLTSGAAIADSGPGGTILAYVIMGVVVFTMATALSEMAAFLPLSGAFKSFPSRFVDPALGFTNGWCWWLGGVFTVAAELVGSGILMKYWFPGIPSYVWAFVFLAIMLAFNLFKVKNFGESTLWISSIKIAAVIVFIIVGVLLITGVIKGSNAGFSNWTLDGGSVGKAPFVGGLGGVVSAFLVAGFSFSNVELVGASAAESLDPGRDVPRATYIAFLSIFIFYIGSLFVIGTLIPFTNENLLNAGFGSIALSPFTLIFNMAGFKVGASVMNIIILTALLTSGNATLYNVGRTLCSLGESEDAPRFVTAINKRGVPARAIIITAIFCCIAFLTSIFGDGKIYTVCYSMVGITAFLNWFSISVSHYRFRKAYLKQGNKIEDLKYKAPLYPYGTAFGIIMCIVIIMGSSYWAFASGFTWYKLLINCGEIPLAIVLYFSYKCIRGTKIVPLDQCDLTMPEKERINE